MTTKREPRRGEPVLHHLTVDTGDVRRFAIVPENFDPGAVASADHMLRTGQESAGLRFTLEPGHKGVQQFTVWAGQQAITRNLFEALSTSQIRLSTQLLPSTIALSKGLLLMSASAEQCAAIALALAAGMGFPGFELVRKVPKGGDG